MLNPDPRGPVERRAAALLRTVATDFWQPNHIAFRMFVPPNQKKKEIKKTHHAFLTVTPI